MTETNDVVKPKRGPKPKIAQVESKEQQQSQTPSIYPETKNDDETIVVEKVAEKDNSEVSVKTSDADQKGVDSSNDDLAMQTAENGNVQSDLSSSQVEIAQDESKEQQQSQPPSIDPETKNDDETIVVEKVAESNSSQINALVVEVRNLGLRTIFEPISKTTIAPGQTLKIECSTLSVKQSVLNNLKQFIDLGKNLEVLQND
ncbi:hypothetical protein GWP85_07240 [Acinetobacter beijerinckii]|uniref:hypothetical protein n=1 Tax=Acinetobacter beijerinckii TaxID=262668 RepID=UPI0023DDE853|nr:hypothetical protein [Acinetobacter beijerinckii]MDF2417309.1 hypothetical protein [Acinetobacter beijerinckii]